MESADLGPPQSTAGLEHAGGVVDGNPRSERVEVQWIGRDDAKAVVPGNGKDRYLPATCLRKDFTLAKPPQCAVLYVTSQGIVEPRLNGQKVGDDFLVPGWTDYRKRIYYRAYDVTPQVRQGDNTLAPFSATAGSAAT